MCVWNELSYHLIFENKKILDNLNEHHKQSAHQTNSGNNNSNNDFSRTCTKFMIGSTSTRQRNMAVGNIKTNKINKSAVVFGVGGLEVIIRNS